MLTTGTNLGPYRIEATLGSGGMGDVYLATDTRLNRRIAIKTLQERFSNRTDWKQRFQQEAQAIAALSHPHICTIFDIGHHDGIDFIVMEYLEGQTLAARLNKGALPLDEATRYALEIADALNKTHRRGVIHRDLKPANVMITKSGVKLLDFGLARLHEVTPDQGIDVSVTRSHAEAGTLAGTPQYMAPEQIEHGQCDARTDIFAFGCVLHEMLTGQKAFSGGSTISLFAAILRETPVATSTIRSSLPRSLDRLVNVCLAKDPEQRWQHACDIVIQLKAIRDEAPPQAVTATTRRPAALAGWIALGLLSVVLSSFAVTRLFERPTSLPTLRLTMRAQEGLLLGEVPRMALSPDGRYLAYSASPEGGKTQLWIRGLDSAEAKPLTGTENASHPFWSPDSRSIGFVADTLVKRADISGGPARVVCDAPLADSGLAWNSNGTILFAGRNQGPIMQVSAEGGTASPVTKLGPDETAHRWPRFLPDGNHFIYLATNAKPESGTIVLGALDGRQSRRLFDASSMADYSNGYLLYRRDTALVGRPFDAGTLEVSGDAVQIAPSVGFIPNSRRAGFTVSSNGYLAYSEDRGNSRHVSWFDRSGKTDGELAIPKELANPGGIANLQLSPDEKQVAIDDLLDVWFMDLVRGVQSRITLNDALDHHAIWSPDGKSIAFSSNRGGKVFNVYRKSALGLGEDELLVNSDVDVQPADWSPDGKWLLYERATRQGTPPFPRNMDLYALPSGGDTPIPVQATEFDEIQGRFSPDGRWIAFVTNESGVYQVNVRSFPANERKIQISVNGGIQPQWRRDGKELYYIATDGTLMSVRIKALEKGETDLPAPLFVVPFSRNPLQSLSNNTAAIYATRSDGNRFLIIAEESRRSTDPISVIQNWVGILAQRR